ncbi:MAG: hypothetical protein AAF467_11135 [Actinomycetota bacterium]
MDHPLEEPTSELPPQRGALDSAEDAAAFLGCTVEQFEQIQREIAARKRPITLTEPDLEIARALSAQRRAWARYPKAE